MILKITLRTRSENSLNPCKRLSYGPRNKSSPKSMWFATAVLAAALMSQMEVDYAQHIVEDHARENRCILTTDAKAAFQSASRKHCYDVLCFDDKPKKRFAPFFAKT